MQEIYAKEPADLTEDERYLLHRRWEDLRFYNMAQQDYEEGTRRA